MKKLSFLFICLVALQICTAATDSKPKVARDVNENENGAPVVNNNSVISSITSGIPSAYNSIKQTADTIFSSLLKALGLALTTLNENIIKEVQTVKSLYDEYYIPVVNYVETVYNNLVENINQLLNTVLAMNLDVLEQFVLSTNEIVDNIKEEVPAIKPCLDAYEPIREQTVKNYTDALYGTCFEPIRNAANAVAAKGLSIVNENSNYINTKVNAILDCFKVLIPQLTCFTAVTQDIPGKLNQTVTDIAQFALDRFNTGVQEVNQCMVTINNDLVTATKSLGEYIEKCLDGLTKIVESP